MKKLILLVMLMVLSYSPLIGKGGNMPTVDALISKNISNAIKNKEIWNDLIKNVKVYGAKGDGVTDDTNAIDKAIAEGGTLGIPDGTYVYTGSLSEYVPYIGGGLVVDENGDPHPRFVIDVVTTYLLTNLDSYIGFVNHKYNADNGTRVYILPKDTVTTGTGGALKIFGDAYQLGQDYRDLGIYFSADQNGDDGHNGTGVFWINGKVGGATYTDKNPDIAFGFQDGQIVAGRFVYIKNGFGTYPAFVLGAGDATLAPLAGTIRFELHGDMVMRNNDEIKLPNAANSLFSYIKKDSSNNILIGNADTGADVNVRTVGTGGNFVYTNDGNDKVLMTPNYSRFDHAVVTNTLLTVSDTSTTITATAYNRVKFAQPSPVTVTNFTAQDGHRLTILFTNGNTTIQNNANIKLNGAVDFVGTANDILVLENIEGVWYEVSRSVN